MLKRNQPAGIQYVGLAGISQACRDAVIQILQSGTRLTKAWILSCEGVHCLLLHTDTEGHIAVKSGFASGYGGEGPHAFSYALQLLYMHGVELEEYQVDEALLERVDASALTMGDIAKIEASRPKRPNRWSDYVFEKDWDRGEEGYLWGEFKPVIPFAIVDHRIVDLALKFDEHPDQCLLWGYRRLEDIVREKTGIDEHGAKLFQQAFLSDPPKLKWKKIDQGERVGRVALFTGAFMAYRNPRAHREPHKYSGSLVEFLMLNQLFLLEGETVDRRGRKYRAKDPLKVMLKQIDSTWKKPRK